MKKILVSIASFSILIAGTAFAAEKAAQPNANAKDFKATQEMIVKHLDERIDMLQREKACVEAAKSDEDLNLCRERFREERKEALDKMKMGRENRKGAMAPPK